MLDFKQYHRKNPIATKLMVLILVVIALTGIATTLAQLYMSYNNDISDLENRLDHVGVSTLPSITKSLWGFDEEQLKVQVESVLEVEDVIKVIVVWQDWNNEQRTLMADSNEFSNNNGSGQSSPRRILEKKYPLVYTAQNGEERILGELAITASLDSIYTNLVRRAQIITSLQVFSTLFIAAVILLLVRHLLTRHIESIASYTRSLSLDNLNQALELDRPNPDDKTPDELDNVGDAINQMRQKLIDDIAQRQRIEQALLEETNAKLESYRQKDAAEEANRAKSQFLATMSHEIRTPMNGVIGMVELLRETELNDQQKHYLNIINKSGETLLNIINDVLDYSKIEAGKMELERTNFNLQAVIESCIEMFSETGNKPDIELVNWIEEDTPLDLVGDQTRLKQILINLISNAYKFTEEGTIAVSVNQVYTNDGSTLIRFSISDTGIGIHADKHSDLFQTFNQADNSTTRKYGGTGLGLAICKRLTNLMGGGIGVESELGKGSSFWFTARFGLQQPGKRTAADDTSLKGKSILIIAHNKSLTYSLGRYASSCQMDNLSVNSAKGGLEVIAHRRAQNNPEFDYILIDYSSNKNNGSEFNVELEKELSQYQGQIVLLSNLLTEPKAKNIQSSKPIITLRKPITASMLYSELTKSNKAVDNSETEKPAAQIQARNHLSDLHVLVAEDNVVNKLVITGMLEKFGIKPEHVDNGKEALEACQKEERPELIFMDCDMPVMDGFKATELIRSYEKENDLQPITIYALTAHAMQEQKDAVMSCGMDGHISKPITLADLNDVFDQFIRLNSRKKINA